MDRMNRRHFTKLSAAALGGMLAGSKFVHADDKKEEKKEKKSEKHLCRGLNKCKGQGGCGATAGKNACIGTGECATVGHHACAKKNACKGEGGCGTIPGSNECKEKGACAIPLNDKAWAKARERFERSARDSGKKVGNPPPKKK